MKRCLIIFAKEPERGRVKTRLQKRLSKNYCINLYKAFLKDTVELVKEIDCEMRILAYVSENKNPQYLKSIAPSFIFCKQKGRNLGQRMYNAFKLVSKKGTCKTIIIGSDSPTLPPSRIKKAFSKLDKDDIVLGPSIDGGYYLIGLKKPCLDIFKDIKWSSDSVLEKTIENTKRLKKKLGLLKSWYDVDESDVLACLKQDLKKQKKSARWTRNFLKIGDSNGK